MKIAIFTDCYLDLTGGIVAVIRAQKAELERRGHTVYVFSSGFSRSKAALKRLAQEHIYVVPTCRVWGRSIVPIARRPRVIEKWVERNFAELKDFDVFYVHYEAGCSIAGLRLAQRWGRPVVQVMHGREDAGEANIIPLGLRTLVAAALSLFHSWYLPHTVKVPRDDYLAYTLARAQMWTLMVNHANYATLVITPSQHFRRKLQHYGVTRPIRVLPNGVSDELFAANLPPRQRQAGEPLRMIWHSRLSREKRLLPFLEALAQMRQPYHLDVYGMGDEYLRAKSYAKVHRLKAAFHGNARLATVWEGLAHAHLDVLASYDFDTFGMVLVEAEAAGVPVFLADPELREVVPRGSYTLAAGPSPALMAAALDDLAAHPERIEQMSRAMLAHRDAVKISKNIGKLEKWFGDNAKM